MITGTPLGSVLSGCKLNLIEGAIIMNMTLTISAARTIDFETLTDSNTAKTFVLNWVRPKPIEDKPLYKLFVGMLFSGDTA